MLYLPDYVALIASVLITALLATGMHNSRRWLRTTCYSIAILIFITHVFHSRLEYLWVSLIPVPAVVIVKLIMGWGAGIVLLLGLSKYVQRSSDRRLLRVIAGLLTGLLCWVFANHVIPPAVKPDACWYQDTLIQSTRNTCMAAAACTYLRTIGVELSELEASRRGLISRYGGSETHAWRALKLSLPAPEYRIHIARLTNRALLAAEQPLVHRQRPAQLADQPRGGVQSRAGRRHRDPSAIPWRGNTPSPGLSFSSGGGVSGSGPNQSILRIPEEETAMNLLISDYVALLACILLGFLLTLGVLSKHKWLNAVCYTLAVLLFVIHVLHARLEFVWVWLVPHPSVAIIKMAAVWGPLIAILIGLAQHVKRFGDRRALYIICALLVGYCFWVVGRQLIDPGANAATCWNDETMMQSTGTTCVAAATCTYLRTLGFEMTEPEAVRLGLISVYGGSETQAWRILKLRLPAKAYRARIAPLTRAALRQSGKWYLTCVLYSAVVGHAIVFRVAPDGDTVTIRDPLSGEYEQSWAEFRKTWLGVAVWAEPLAQQSAEHNVEVYHAVAHR